MAVDAVSRVDVRRVSFLYILFEVAVHHLFHKPCKSVETDSRIENAVQYISLCLQPPQSGRVLHWLMSSKDHQAATTQGLIHILADEVRSDRYQIPDCMPISLS